MKQYLIVLLIILLQIGCGENSSSQPYEDRKKSSTVYPTAIPGKKGNSWTIMVYLDGDNDLENYAMEDIAEMKKGFVNHKNLNLIVLVDRIDGYSNDSSVLGEDFTGTRLYKITNNKATRLSGHDFLDVKSTGDDDELNMGDGNTLKNFIKFCKYYYSNEKYALILWNHGGGITANNNNSSTPKMVSDICVDDTSGDRLYTAEISDILTIEESVDLLAYDACLMGSVEVAYQYRRGNGGFSADYMVASAPNVWLYGFKYDQIFSRIRSGGGDNGTLSNISGDGNEIYYDPKTLTPKEFGFILVEEYYDATFGMGIQTQSLSCYDLSKVSVVKTSVDALAVKLNSENAKDNFESVRGSLSNIDNLHYFNSSSEKEWLSTPFFDLYDLSDRISSNTNFSSDVRSLSDVVMDAVDQLIVYSFGGTSSYSGTGTFKNGLNGIHIFAPDGNRSYLGSSDNHWEYQWWYNSIDTTLSGTNPSQLYGKIKWCGDNASQNGIIENWFEMLDNWYDSNKNSNMYTP